MKIVFRADSSNEIGSGHIYRCISLAHALKKKGAEIYFCSIIDNIYLIDLIKKDFFLLHIDDYKNQQINYDQNFENVDASQVIKLINSVNGLTPDWIIVDNYKLSIDWHKKIRESYRNIKLLVIDDLANRKLSPDILIDQNEFGKKSFLRYQALLDNNLNPRYCLGPKFALIDNLYSNIKNSQIIRKKISKVLISLGGGGNNTLLEKILKALLKFSDRNISYQLVKGHHTNFSQEVIDYCSKLDIQIINPVKSLAPLISSADLCLGAGGSTTWERLCLGLPTITFSIAPNQVEICRSLNDMGIIDYLGDQENFDQKRFCDVFSKYLNSPLELEKKSNLLMKLVDGRGCERVSNLLFGIGNKWDKVDLNELSRLNIFEKNAFYTNNLNYEKNNSDLLNIVSRELNNIDIMILIKNLENIPNFYLSSRFSNNQKNLKINILSGKDSWMNKYIPQLLESLHNHGSNLRWIHDHNEIIKGDVCFILSYGKIIPECFLKLNSNNLVVHASYLPKGKGWSPMTWQILEGVNEIPLTLFEATKNLDDGPIYSQNNLNFSGNELLDEWQMIQACGTIKICVDWIMDYPNSINSAIPQNGNETIYQKRTPKDSELDINKSLYEQFNLLRVVDNESYPAFFKINGHKFFLKIKKSES